jgi:ribonuclease HI
VTSLKIEKNIPSIHIDIKMTQTIYTDGSCIPNPGPGGWAFCGLKDNKDENSYEWHVSGGECKSTNNRMELTAVIESLKFFADKNKFHIYSDSQYVIKCAKGEYKRRKNVDLWKEYEIHSNCKKIQWTWVKAHNNNKYNEIVDFLAKQEAKSKI